jgi:hypothetical protein
MLEHARLVDHAVWVVALTLYAYDAARLLGPHDVLLVEAGRGRLTPMLSDPPFTSWTRVLTFAPLHAPHRGVLSVVWGRPWRDDRALAALLGSLDLLRSALAPVRVTAALAAALLFVVGPALTLALGPDAAVLYAAAGLYPTVLAAVAVLWFRRRRLGLTSARCGLLSVEMLVCPAFLPNLVRKLTQAPPLDADAVQLARATADAETAADFAARVERRAREMLDADDADPSARSRLRAYLAALGAAR